MWKIYTILEVFCCCCCLSLNFLFFEIIHYFPHVFLSSNSPIYPSLLSFKFMGSFSINYCYMMHVYLYTYITKYNLISLYVILMCVFGGVLYCVTSWWVCYSLRQTISPTLRTPWWRDALYIRLRPPALSMSLFPCLLLFLFGSCLNSHVGETPWLSLLTFLGDASHSKAPGSLALTGILSSLLKGSLVLGCDRCVVNV